MRNIKIRGSSFLDHPVMNENIEAAYKIVMELQERGLLEVKIDRKEGEEPLILWEIDTDRELQS